MSLHRAEHRGYRELFLTAREAETRLDRLSEVIPEDGGTPLAKASVALGELVDELKPVTEENDLHVDLAAEGGGRIGMVRSAILDRFLERNQALRLAVDDLEHVTTLLAYLASLGEQRRARKLPELCHAWERKLRRHVSAVRKAAVELAADPDAAIEPLDPSPVGKAAHGAAVAAGSMGEALDRSAAKSRRLFSRH